MWYRSGDVIPGVAESHSVCSGTSGNLNILRQPTNKFILQGLGLWLFLLPSYLQMGLGDDSTEPVYAQADVVVHPKCGPELVVRCHVYHLVRDEPLVSFRD